MKISVAGSRASARNSRGAKCWNSARCIPIFIPEITLSPFIRISACWISGRFAIFRSQCAKATSRWCEGDHRRRRQISRGGSGESWVTSIAIRIPRRWSKLIHILFEPMYSKGCFRPRGLRHRQEGGSRSARWRSNTSSTNLPTTACFLIRALVGLEGIITALGVTDDYRSIFAKCVERALIVSYVGRPRAAERARGASRSPFFAGCRAGASAVKKARSPSSTKSGFARHSLRVSACRACARRSRENGNPSLQSTSSTTTRSA